MSWLVLGMIKTVPNRSQTCWRDKREWCSETERHQNTALTNPARRVGCSTRTPVLCCLEPQKLPCNYSQFAPLSLSPYTLSFRLPLSSVLQTYSVAILWKFIYWTWDPVLVAICVSSSSLVLLFSSLFKLFFEKLCVILFMKNDG